MRDLKSFVTSRLRTFYEEELDVPLVVFDEVLDHALRIDAVLRTPMGHALLVGDSGVGKTVLSRFVAWMNGLSVVQIVASRRYTLAQFDDDLRAAMRHIYENLYAQMVMRNPEYEPGAAIKCENFCRELDRYVGGLP